jgi:isocitrate/isopropylmalate dehydrogenase
MLLAHLGFAGPAATLRECLRRAVSGGTTTPDLGGTATTEEFTAAVLRLVERSMGER